MKKIIFFSLLVFSIVNTNLYAQSNVTFNNEILEVQATATSSETDDNSLVSNEDVNEATPGERKVNISFIYSEVVIQILATIFLIVLIKKVAWDKFLVMIDQRKNYINESIEEASKNKEETTKLRQEQEIQIKELKVKTQSILEESKREAKVQEGQIVDEAKNKAKTIIQKANQEIKDQEEEVKAQLSKELAQNSVSIVEKIIGQEITGDVQSKLIEQALREVKHD